MSLSQCPSSSNDPSQDPERRRVSPFTETLIKMNLEGRKNTAEIENLKDELSRLTERVNRITNELAITMHPT